MNRIFWDAILLITGSFFTFGVGQGNSTIDSRSSIKINSKDASNTTNTSTPTTNATITTDGTTTTIPPFKKFVAAAVRSHFDDCPDSHTHFCLHGTCRFLILEDIPACVCHQGFVGVRCEHADLLAVVATNHKKHTFATLVVMYLVACIVTILFCAVLHLWMRDCRRRRLALQYLPEKSSSMLTGHASCYLPESVV